MPYRFQSPFFNLQNFAIKNQAIFVEVYKLPMRYGIIFSVNPLMRACKMAVNNYQVEFLL